MSDKGENPCVSLVIATHAGDSLDFLQQAVESVSHQTYGDLELLVVADGPLRVETEAWLSERARQDPRIEVIGLPENRGPAAARNAAIARARGGLIAILDADDRALPGRIDSQVAFLQSSGADVAGSGYRIIDEAGRALGEKRFPLEGPAIRRAMAFYNPIANSTVIAKADVLKNNSYPEGLRYGEDYALWIKLARAGYVLRNMPELLVEFRIDRRFLHRRRGLDRARSEIKNKLTALPLYPAYTWPLLVLVALSVSFIRLLPVSCLRPAYWLRGKLHRGR